MGADSYRYIDQVPGELASGQPVGPGETVKLSEEDFEDPHNKAMLEDGKLVAVAEQAEPVATEAAAKLAKKEKVELTAITPTGANGEIVIGDVERHVAELKEREEGS